MVNVVLMVALFGAEAKKSFCWVMPHRDPVIKAKMDARYAEHKYEVARRVATVRAHRGPRQSANAKMLARGHTRGGQITILGLSYFAPVGLMRALNPPRPPRQAAAALIVVD